MNKTKRLNQEDLDKVLWLALPTMLQRTRETEPASVGDLVRLVDVQQRIAPEKATQRKVTWKDWS